MNKEAYFYSIASSVLEPLKSLTCCSGISLYQSSGQRQFDNNPVWPLLSRSPSVSAPICHDAAVVKAPFPSSYPPCVSTVSPLASPYLPPRISSIYILAVTFPSVLPASIPVILSFALPPPLPHFPPLSPLHPSQGLRYPFIFHILRLRAPVCDVWWFPVARPLIPSN